MFILILNSLNFTGYQPAFLTIKKPQGAAFLFQDIDLINSCNINQIQVAEEMLS